MYPMLRVPAAGRQMLDSFGGYNHNERIGDGEFFDMKNLSSHKYPLLSPRKKRGIYTRPERCTGMIGKDALCYVDGSCFVMNGYRVEMGLSEEEKQLVGMGAYVIILPDKKFINTENLTDWGNIEAKVQSRNPVQFSLCELDGTAYDPDYIQAAQPEDPQNDAIWADTSQSPVSLKQWSEASGMWTAVATTYVRIESPGIGKAFSQYDGVTISGLKDAELLDADSGEIIHSAELQAFDGSFVLHQRGDDFLVITGVLSGTRKISNSITVQRKMPRMDFVIEAENRLWGCYYGPSEDGSKVLNEIYCSKLGDFKNWNCFNGISTDSWVASVGSDGGFTGAVSYLGHPLFFKESMLHQIYISEVGAHSIKSTACRGVQKGSHRSLAIVGETLYYKSLRGVCAFGGAQSTEVSRALGSVSYRDAAAGADANRYYISMCDDAGAYQMFVLDTEKGIWYREDEIRAACFCTCRGQLYFLDAADGAVKTVSGEGEQEPGEVEWMAQTGLIGLSMPDMKYLSRLVLRLSLPQGSRIQGLIQYDSDGVWRPLFSVNGTGTRSFPIPVRPVRCDHMQLRLEGSGDFTLYSITKMIEQGSDIS